MIHIVLLDLQGVEFATAGFWSESHNAGDAWRWIAETIGRRYDCDYADIDFVEAGDDDDPRGERILVCGRPVAIVRTRLS